MRDDRRTGLGVVRSARHRLLLIAMAALASCVQPIEGGGCPCLDGWACCEGSCVDQPFCARSESRVASLRPAASCRDLFSAGAPSGVYLVGAGAAAHRAYCQVPSGLELCTEQVAEHDGSSLDQSGIPFRLTSVLEGDWCKVWNVHNREDQRPIDAFEVYSDDFEFISVDPCSTLGFGPVVAQSRLGARSLGYRRSLGCPYGSSSEEGFGSCGYESDPDQGPLMKWANFCSGCEVNPGKFHNYLLQGEIKASHIPWDATGDYFVMCQTRALQ
jgi:hypothetical protein